MGKCSKRWLPLESNPEVMNAFIEKLGIDTSLWAFCDIFGLDPVRYRVILTSVPGISPSIPEFSLLCSGSPLDGAAADNCCPDGLSHHRGV
jgi:hypothetical protein